MWTRSRLLSILASPPFAARIVFVGWAILSVLVFVFVQRYGRNVPAWEEWYDLPVFFGDAPRLPWLVDRLHEHRYVLGRMVFLAAFDLSGQDFRAGMYLSAAILAAAAWLLTRAATEARGRADVADLLLPVLVLTPAGYENLLLGYQVQFTLSVLVAAAFIRLAGSADRVDPLIPATKAGALTVPLALGGWVGLAFVPPMAAWVGWLLWRDRARLTTRGLIGRLVCPVVSCAIFALCYVDVLWNPTPGRVPNDLPTAARVAREFAATMFGGLAVGHIGAAGVVAIAVMLAVAGLLGWQTVVRGSRSAGGGLVVLAAVVLMAVATAQGRTDGFSYRSIPLTGLVLAVGYLALVRFGWLASWAARVVLLALAAALTITGWSEGTAAGRRMRHDNQAFVNSAASGVPINYLADRHFLFPDPGLKEAVLTLRAHRHPSVAGATDPPHVIATPLPVPPPTYDPVPGDPFAGSVSGRPPVWRFDISSPAPVVAVRVRFRYPRTCIRVLIHVIAAGPTPGEPVSTAASSAWLTPRDWTLEFWLNRPAATLWLRPLSADDAFEVLDVQLLQKPPD